MPRTAKKGASASRAVVEQVYAPTRAAWRRWLAKNHTRDAGVWLIFDKLIVTGKRLDYAHAVEEALCFGWIDSTLRSLDEKQYMQLFAPRKPKSTWSRVNKERVSRLMADGLMMPPGHASIELAKRNGAWESLDGVESLSVPDDLRQALARNPNAARNFDAFSPSSRKGYLHWLNSAKRPETRASRIAEIVSLSEQNRKSRHL
ncbi:MAG TPA: YdeI/OmpD-associated family protein [Candidatus Elarobacter sp.]|nr:YdeI/OmpD-associated family protein [Candidatus Elarobacter sp.]